MKVEKADFDSALVRLLRAKPLPLSAIPRKKKKKPARAVARKPTR